MTKRDIFSISIKILGVISVMYAVIQIPSIVVAIGSVFQRQRQDFFPYWYLGATIISPILILVVAYILLRWGDLIAGRLVREDSEIPALGIKEWERPVSILSLRIIGVVCLIRGIPKLFEYLTDLAFLREHQKFLYPNTWAGIIGATVLIIIGGYLILGGKHLVKFVFRGLKTTPSSDNSG